MKTNIYLDIDGVLLAKDLKPTKHVNAFLRKVLTDYPDTTYWLTTHCNGDARVPMRHIGHLFEPDVQVLMTNIKPTTWDTAKTRGIDFTIPFLWFDDNVFYEEKRTLIENNVLDNLIEVNLTKQPDQLAEFVNDFPAPIS